MKDEGYHAGYAAGVRATIECAALVAQIEPRELLLDRSAAPTLAQLADAIARISPERLATLKPFDARETVSVKQAAAIAGRHVNTVIGWTERFRIGRKVAGGRLLISRVALAALLDDDVTALGRYLAGDRIGPMVRPYFERAGLPIALT